MPEASAAQMLSQQCYCGLAPLQRWSLAEVMRGWGKPDHVLQLCFTSLGPIACLASLGAWPVLCETPRLAATNASRQQRGEFSSEDFRKLFFHTNCMTSKVASAAVATAPAPGASLPTPDVLLDLRDWLARHSSKLLHQGSESEEAQALAIQLKRFCASVWTICILL